MSVTVRTEVFGGPRLDVDQWDAFVAAMKGAHVFQSSLWARFKQAQGWKPHFCHLEQRECLRATALALVKHAGPLPCGGICYVPRGPVLDYEDPNALGYLDVLLTQLIDLSRKCGALMLRISPDRQAGDERVRRLLASKGFTHISWPIQHECTFRLDLTQDWSVLEQNLEARVRHTLRTIAKKALRLESSNGLNHLKAFYDLYSSTMRNAGLVPKPFAEMRLMQEALLRQNGCKVCVLYCNEQPVAGAMLLCFGGRVWYLYGGSIRSKEASGAGVQLHWEIIHWAKAQGYREYDLQGIPCTVTKGDPLFGVYLFKRGFGGRRVELIGEHDYYASRALAILAPLAFRAYRWLGPHLHLVKRR